MKSATIWDCPTTTLIDWKRRKTKNLPQNGAREASPERILLANVHQMSDPTPPNLNETDHAAGGLIARRLGLLLGLLAFGTMTLLGPPQDLSPKAWSALSLLALMVIWWVSEAIPVAATALLPLAFLPLLGVVKPGEAAAPYGDPIIFLFIGGFMIAAAIEQCGLHRRIALGVLANVGSSPAAIVGGFMIATTLLSMWISNTATALMMMPIALAVCNAATSDLAQRRSLIAATVLGVAYCASIGGVGTPIGSPTNLIGIKWLEANDAALSFPSWMVIGLSIIAVMLPVTWVILTKIAYRLPKHLSDAQADDTIKQQYQALGPMGPSQTRMLAVFLGVALAWMFREPLSKLPGGKGLTDMVIAVLGAISLFIIPAGDKEKPGKALLDWSVAERIPWGIAILFGGGLSMAAALEAVGVSDYVGAHMAGLGTLPVLAVVITLVAITVFASELASNVATLTALLPVLTAIVVATGADPLIIGASATFAASFGFMLPIATAANAIAFATGAPKQKEMLRIGFALNVIGIVTIASAVALLALLVRG
jgi:solute carrier family 13 (sodium-dependent dicarboxylate transporter), member 2/3/5